MLPGAACGARLLTVSRFVTAAFAALLAGAPAPARAENAARLIGYGPASRAMGGTGIAYPQDAVTALTLNPAMLPLRPCSDTTEVDLTGTLITAQANPYVVIDGQRFKARDNLLAPITTIGVAMPQRKELPARVVTGMSIYAAGGLGADFRDTQLDQPDFYDLGGGVTAPIIAGVYSRYYALSLGPSIGVEVVEGVTIGVQGILTASTFDVGSGATTGFCGGFLVGLGLRPLDSLRLGLTYLSAQRTRFRHVVDVNGDGYLDKATLELPEQPGFGVAFEPIADMLILEVDVKWNRWSAAEGLADLDWRDQWVVATGVQVRPLSALALRAGYNHGRAPAHRHPVFSGTAPVPRGGASLPGWYHETGRLIGSSAMGQHHLTLGAGYELTENLTANVGWVLGFPESIREAGTDLLGRPASLKMRVSRANTLEFGLQFNF